MYGTVLIPHKNAINLCEELKEEGFSIETHIFELGYLRPNFVTLETIGVNYNSSLILKSDFYSIQKGYDKFPIARKPGLRLRKYWKIITFINHCFQNYKLVNITHKLQPKPIYLWFQLKGLFLKYYFRLSEFNLKRRIFSQNEFFIVILQVSSDSQVIFGSEINSNEKFIDYVISNYSMSNLKNTNLIFKHHPRDRGYNNYRDLIIRLSKKYNVSNSVFLFS